MIWHGWGDPRQRPGLSPRAEAYLVSKIGPLARSTPPVDLAAVRVGQTQLSSQAHALIADIVGPDGVLQDHLTRVQHAGGKSYPDLLRRRQGDATAAPDAVVFPQTHAQVMRVLQLASDQRIAVVPFGGGTSVVGGVEPQRGPFTALISLDLSLMNHLVGLDEESLVATFEPGMTGAAAEVELRRRGYSLGHFPQSYAYASIGGYVATRSAGQASTGHGRIDQKLLGVRVATPSGDLRLGRSPATAAGPDLRQVILGSEGTLGVITEATLAVHHAPEIEVYEAYAVPSFEAGAAILRELAQANLAPDVCRLSDESETQVFVQQSEGLKGFAFRNYLRLRGYEAGSLMILGWDGPREQVGLRRSVVRKVLADHQTLRLGTRPGDAWAHSRFDGAYLRDDLMDRGILIETLETATTWSNYRNLYTNVRAGLAESLADRGTPALIMCHISHLYATGCSLYYTWIARQHPGHELQQWRDAKTVASQAIMDAGGTITHHHAVGIDHRPYLRAEIGDAGMALLQAMKDTTDPVGILNPGKLL